MIFYKLIKKFLNLKFWLFLWNYWKGSMAMVSQDYGKAITYLNHCTELNTSFVESGLIYEQLGKCYFGINDIEKGKYNLLKACESVRNEEELNSEISSRLGFIFFQEGEISRAKYYLEHAKDHYKKSDFTNIAAVKEYLLKVNSGGN